MNRRRLSLTIVGPLLVALVLILAFVVVIVIGIVEGTAITRQRAENNNRATLSVVARLLSTPLHNSDEDGMNNILAELPGGETSIIYASARDTTGQIVTEVTEGWTPDEQAGRDAAAQALVQQSIAFYETEEGYLVLCGPITADSEQIGTVEIAFDQTQLDASVGSMQTTMGLLAVALVTGAIVIVGLLTRYAMMPIRTLTAAANEIGRGNLAIAVPVRGTQETAALGTALERMRTDLQELYQNLEQQVADLEHYARRLEATAAVARDAASVLDPQQLLSRAVILISRQLGFYHTAIYLLDITDEWAVLEAASSEGGQQMLTQGHRLQVGEESAVGRAAGQGKPCIMLDVGADAMHFDNPLLPDTRSEMALPLRARGDIIGVLDVQSAEPEAFGQEDVAVLQTLADQVALAISNARLFQQTQESMEAQRRAYGEIGRQAWTDVLLGREGAGYYCDASGTRSLAEYVGTQDDQDDGELPALSVPITVREQVIGTVSVRKTDDTGTWTEEETTLMKALADQLGTALESARLYQDTQYRASRERLIGEIVDSMRRAVDMDTLLQTALQQTADIMGTSSAFVQLSAPPEESEEEWTLDGRWLDELMGEE